MPSHYNTGEDYLEHERKKKKKSLVDKLKDKSTGTGWGKITRQKDQKRVEKLRDRKNATEKAIKNM